MTLTEEQRGALARAIDYIDKTDLPVGKLDGFDREVLRNMATAAINHDPDVMKMIELLAAGEHDQWSAWAQSILDSEPGLSEGRKAAWPGMIATPYENLSEELKDKDRREVHLRSGVALDHIQQQSIEIERLRGYEIAARDLSADLTKVAGDRDEHAARIKELEDALIEQEARFQYYVQNENCESWPEARRRYPELNEKYLKIARQHLQAEGKIGPDARPKCDHAWQAAIEERGYQTCLKCGECRNIEDIPRTAPAWQITKERIGLLEYCLETLLDAPDIEEIPGPGHSIEMLRAMLREAGL